ncbi:MAG: ABC transporter ATP-binding protein [Clostridiales bacterium]|nr:ABC transporter ATP-binding protein [Clostridiales bacterium]
MENQEALRVEKIVKVYPNGVVANKGIDFTVREGEIHALSGENGAGKSTLMKMIFGEEQPTSGEIYVMGKKEVIASPQMAIALGIGMVHQHFMLVPSLTVTENIILGMEPRKRALIDMKLAEDKVREIGDRYNFRLNPETKIEDLTVSQKQKVEILKILYRGARILIFDEPTAVLTPQETGELFAELKKLRADGYTIIFISHKLDEVMELCDRITIIRKGKSIGVYNISDISEQEISDLMVGRKVELTIEKRKARPRESLIKVRHLRVVKESGKEAITDLSFDVRAGEILGIAGIEGNGQSELVEVLTGLQKYSGGLVEINGHSIKRASIRQIRRMSVAHIPEDRMTTGIAPALSILENILADKVDLPKFTRHGVLKRNAIRSFGNKVIKDYQIFCKDSDERISSLSGGNIQKVVLARELSNDPKVIIADQPTRGVDVGATEFIRKRLISMRDLGCAILLISSDLNEVLGVSDSIMVMREGKIAGYFPDASEVNELEIGSYMLGVKAQSEKEIGEAVHER